MLIGRDAEREHLAEFLGLVRGGRSQALVLVGDPGIGKTALLEDTVAAADELRVVRATGFELESDLAFAGLASILGGFTGLIDRLPGPQALALAGALGVGPPPGPGDRFTAYAGALSLLAEAALDGPLLVAVDDAHWLDHASLDALAFCARRVAAEGIGLLFAARHEPASMTRRAGGMRVMHVGGLAAGSGVRLLERAAATPIAEAVARRLVEGSLGNPLALLEAARLLSPAQRTGAEALPRHLPIGDELARAFTVRARGLPARTRRALLIAAAGAGDPVLVHGALTSEGLVDALPVAEAQGLVRVGAGGVSFTHPLVRTGVYRAAGGAQRRDAHAVLAVAAGALGAAGAVGAARHRAAAAEGPDEEVAGALHEAGRLAASRLGHAEAATLIAQAASLTPDPARRAPRRLEAGGLAMVAGLPDLARACLDAAIEESTDQGVIIAARGARAHLEMWTGNVAPARDMLTAEADRIEAMAPHAAAMMRVDAALASGMVNDLRMALTLAERAAAQEGLPEHLEVVTQLMLIALHALDGRPDVPARIREAPDPLRGLSGADPSDWMRVGSCSQVFIWADEATATDALSRLIGVARAASAPAMLPYPLTVHAERLRASGDFEGALAAGGEALNLADETGQTSLAALARSVLAWVAAVRGEDERCRELTSAALVMAEATGAKSLVVFIRAALGLLHLGQGRDADALGELLVVEELTVAAGFRSHVMSPFLPELVEAAVRCRRLEDAHRALAYLSGMDRAGLPRTQGAVERCRGLVEADNQVAVGHLAAAVALEDGAGAPFEAARSRLVLGERLLRTRNRQQALEPLQAAYGTFARLGAAPWAERAADALGTLRARPESPPAAPVDLTPQERQVAYAAAQGLTNREIAGRLFLSVKTVEFHLGNGYRKLGVRNRTGLARRLHG